MVLCLNVIVALGLLHQIPRLTEEARAYEQARDRLMQSTQRVIKEAKVLGVSLTEARAQAVNRETEFASRLADHRSFSWTQFLNDLEHTVPGGVSITAISVNFHDGLITLSGLALSVPDVTAFTRRLEAHDAFHDVFLAEHHATSPSHGSDLTGSLADFRMTVRYHRLHAT
jgi:Tfp pilus assembly protein PilN